MRTEIGQCRTPQHISGDLVFACYGQDEKGIVLSHRVGNTPLNKTEKGVNSFGKFLASDTDEVDISCTINNSLSSQLDCKLTVCSGHCLSYSGHPVGAQTFSYCGSVEFWIIDVYFLLPAGEAPLGGRKMPRLTRPC